MTGRLLLGIDQGTTSTRALLLAANGQIVASAQRPIEQHYPQDGWVEHDGEEIFASVLECVRKVLVSIDLRDVAGIGITNQRETTLLWDRRTSRPLHRAIVWQDRRTAEICERLRREGRQDLIQEKTGLLIDPYFSGTKLAWLLDHVPGAREAAESGALAFGTVDSWLIWRLTQGASHVTDATNASRTLLYNIRSGGWDGEILSWLSIPKTLLPEVRDSAAAFGVTAKELGFELPILGVAGDQQAAAFGQACFKPGMVKSTYGTGCFMLLNTGTNVPRSKNRLLGTIAYQLGGKPAYALEGSIFMAGAIMDWLKDIGIVGEPRDVGPLAKTANPKSHCYLVPAFTGLGAPYWSTEARGALVGMTRDTGPAEIAAGALDSVCYQSRDLLEAMNADTGVDVRVMRIDGGMARSEIFMQRLADLTGVEVVRASNTETTVLGAAYLAGLQAGLISGLGEVEALWKSDASFKPAMNASDRNRLYDGWKKAVARTL